MAIIHSSEGRTSINWASGTSTEIFIYPSDASFAERDFLFRLSTATVEKEETSFSFFEGITRHLMILKGKLELIHEGRYTKLLGPYDQDTFSGEWQTRSKGKVTDFNLMLRAGATGFLKHHTTRSDRSITVQPDADFHFVYIASGSATVSDGTEAVSSDLIELIDSGVVELTGEADLIEIQVKLPKQSKA